MLLKQSEEHPLPICLPKLFEGADVHEDVVGTIEIDYVAEGGQEQYPKLSHNVESGP